MRISSRHILFLVVFVAGLTLSEAQATSAPMDHERIG